MGIPAERFIAHGSRAEQLAECGIDATGIASTVESLLECAGRSPRDGGLEPVRSSARG
jgi:deoxyxylulose-5-phosphate synthase